MKIASWNVNSLRVRLEHVMDWLVSNDPDVLGLQETKVVDDQFPLEVFTEKGYHVSFAGQKTYNGVAVISKMPLSDVVVDFPGFEDIQRRVIAVSVGDYRVLNCYVPNGSDVGSEKYAYKLRWLKALQAYLVSQLKQHEKVIVMGDFNIAPEDRDVYDPATWQDKILCSDLEREALQRILDLGFQDSFRLFDQEKDLFSWWDYRTMAFRRNRGLRIDLMLTSEALSAKCVKSGVDLAPRKLERPSDHAPVFCCFK
jgi:exodeoxyribonuclease III